MKAFTLFRTDVGLREYWWHRLFVVAFISLFLVTVLIAINDLYRDYQLPKYTKVGPLTERMDSNVRLIGTLVHPNEKIAVYEHNLYGSYQDKSLYSSNGGWLLNREYYCSTNIANQVDDLVAKTGVSYFKGNLNLVSSDEFKAYLLQNNAKCVKVLDLDSKVHYGNVKKALSWGLEAENMNVFEKSLLKSGLTVLQNVLFIVVGFFIIAVLYHKVFLYIVFGNTETKKKS